MVFRNDTDVLDFVLQQSDINKKAMQPMNGRLTELIQREVTHLKKGIQFGVMKQFDKSELNIIKRTSKLLKAYQISQYPMNKDSKVHSSPGLAMELEEWLKTGKVRSKQKKS